MRDKLIELLNDVTFGVNVHTLADHLKRETIEAVADHLLAAGVIVPPCKVGDTLYVLHTNHHTGKRIVFEHDVEEVCYCSNRGVRPWVISCFTVATFDNCDFGKTVFLTKEEAEKALAERSRG